MTQPIGRRITNADDGFPMKPERRADLVELCNNMQTISDAFYYNARRHQNHAFIEFAGLMNEYIKICRDSLESGIDFTECNIHSGKPLAIQPFQAAYLAEKFECIFGASLTATPEIAKLFAERITGMKCVTPDEAAWIEELSNRVTDDLSKQAGKKKSRGKRT